jgi:hypothetical protein
MFKKRRGISEMIAVVLLLIIVSVAGIALYKTSLDSMTNQYEGFTEQVTVQNLASKERFEVVSVQYVDPQNVIAYLYSYTPDTALTTKISKVYVNNVNATWDSSLGGVLPRNEVVQIAISAPQGLTFNPNEIKILVVSQRGVGYAYP